MTLDIDAIEARANAAEPGPWKNCISRVAENSEPSGYSVHSPEGPWICHAQWDSGVFPDDAPNMAFIAAARQDVPALCAEVRELRAALGRLQGEVETILNTEPHADSCPIGIDGVCNCWQARLQTALDGEK